MSEWRKLGYYNPVYDSPCHKYVAVLSTTADKEEYYKFIDINSNDEYYFIAPTIANDDNEFLKHPFIGELTNLIDMNAVDEVYKLYLT